MYAIRNIKTGKFLFGTDFRYFPRHQRTSLNQVKTYNTLAEAKYDYLHRTCGKDYRIVKLKPVEVEKVIDFDSPGVYEPKTEDWEEY